MPDRVTLTVNGQRYGGWTSLEVTRSLEAIAGTFTLAVTERWPEAPVRRAIHRGDRCTVAIGDDVVLTGWVDAPRRGFDARGRTVTIRGRDATGDLVDCSAVHTPGQWRNRRLEQIAADLCRPFGIPVRRATDTGAPFRDVALHTGETVFEALERLCRHRAVLLVSDGQGGLVLTRAGTRRVSTVLAEGENLLAAELEDSERERYSRYVVKGQHAGDDTVGGGAAAEPQGEARDPGVKRDRPLIVLAEDQGDAGSFRERAQWEANVRAGRGTQGTATVQGWRDATGALWTPNTLVHVRSTTLEVDGPLLITSVTYHLSEQGSTTTLTLTRREAFDRIPLPEADEDLV
ncbi:MAG TPA: hypothetical protein VF406_02740 [Thermodesulfobacteriota bacterium]